MTRLPGLRATLVGLSLLVASPLAAVAQGVGLPLGTPAPAVTLEDLDGNAVDLQRLVAGKPALIEFWATWCEQCEALQPQIDRIQAAHGERVAVVAVAVAVSQSLRRVKRHVEEHDPGYPFLWDARGAAVRAFQAPTTSVVVMLDATGNVVYTGSGADQDLEGAVARVLEEG
ncbi:MAG: TlpA disulfide reductase family protein [Gemmatimonadota bacterium]|nr:TlpA family protein disulfide reductase [Gemmatimonadota bacterium]